MDTRLASARPSVLETHWSLILWNPWFVIGGILLIVAAVHTPRITGADGSGYPRRSAAGRS
jgi:hypothetical protein